jgi:hypothetical protein
MKTVEADRSRLNKYKTSKAERLKELEDKVQQIELFDNIDTDKLVAALHRKTVKLDKMSSLQATFETKLTTAENTRVRMEKKLTAKFTEEQLKT